MENFGFGFGQNFGFGMPFSFGFGIITSFGFGRNFGSKSNRKPKFVDAPKSRIECPIIEKKKIKKFKIKNFPAFFNKHFLNTSGVGFKFKLTLSCKNPV